MELRRRKVYGVAVAYVAVAFVIVEGADLVFPALLLPFWAYTLVVVLAIAGLPVALVLAWALEITPEGIRRTAPGAPERPARDPLPDRPGPVPLRDTGGRSIAVLPFVNLRRTISCSTWWRPTRPG